MVYCTCTGGFAHVLLYIRPRGQSRRNALKPAIKTHSRRATLLEPAPAPAPVTVLSLLLVLLPVRALRLFLPSFSSFLASPSATLATSQRLATYLEQNHLRGVRKPVPGRAVIYGRVSALSDTALIAPRS